VLLAERVLVGGDAEMPAHDLEWLGRMREMKRILLSLVCVLSASGAGCVVQEGSDAPDATESVTSEQGAISAPGYGALVRYREFKNGQLIIDTSDPGTVESKCQTSGFPRTLYERWSGTYNSGTIWAQFFNSSSWTTYWNPDKNVCLAGIQNPTGMYFQLCFVGGSYSWRAIYFNGGQGFSFGKECYYSP